MLRRESFERQAYYLKWRWGNPEKTSEVIIEQLDWQQPERVIESRTVSYQQFISYYRSRGVDLQCHMRVPALVRVTETAERSGRSEVVTGPMEIALPANNKLQIQWRKEKPEKGMQKITVQFPGADLVSYSAYPERMVYFLVNYKEEPWNEGARYYLPRPSGNGIQEYWFDITAGCEIALRMDSDQPVDQNGLFRAGDVFSIQ